MAYDIIRGTRTKRDWSCGAVDAPATSSHHPILKGLVAGAAVAGGYLLWQGMKKQAPVPVKKHPGNQRMYMRMSPSGRMIMTTNPAGF